RRDDDCNDRCTGCAGHRSWLICAIHWPVHDQPSRCATPERSSSSSARVLSMYCWLKSSIGRSLTRVYSPFSVVTGKPNITPSGMPKLPSNGTTMATHLPLLPSTQSSTRSIAELAAKADEDRQRAPMMVEPRLLSVG